ncbi:hypothetical conserved protein [Rhizobium etli CIAT 652]|uniref:Hypothetical conserved protein n=1 Tax=Rhizobium etli (strain CIAT 652) TaxID=491916 RepID=B3PRY6_RHIE6|nr:hypothetical conserved protein [Rhizobium etli CIAT 652]
MRIAVGGIHIECSTYNPVLNEESDFRVLRGAGLLESPYFAFLRDYDAEFLPTIHARAIAGGPVSRATYEAFKSEFLERLKPLLPLDGLYLAMHGAMYVDGMEDAEGDWIGAARALVGEDCMVSASYDLHGNVTQRIIDALDIYSTYRTAPHIDVEETMRRSVAMLVKSLKTRVRPLVLWAPIPVVLPGERTSTVDEPAKSLYALLPEIDAIDGVWDASLMVGYVWADEPRATAAAIMTGTDRAVLEREAKRLAQAYWDAREDFVFGCETGSVAECVARAIASPTAPVVLAESGDNPTGGGVGDRADVLAELMSRNATGVVFAGIADREATEACYAAGVGHELELSVGASLDTQGSKPVLGRFHRQVPARNVRPVRPSGGGLARRYRSGAFGQAAALSQYSRLHPARARPACGQNHRRQVGLSLAGTGPDCQSEPDGPVGGRRRSVRRAPAAAAQAASDLSFRQGFCLRAAGLPLCAVTAGLRFHRRR